MADLMLTIGGLPPFAWRILDSVGELVATKQSNTIEADLKTGENYTLELIFMSDLAIMTYGVTANEKEIHIRITND